MSFEGIDPRRPGGIRGQAEPGPQPSIRGQRETNNMTDANTNPDPKPTDPPTPTAPPVPPASTTEPEKLLGQTKVNEIAAKSRNEGAAAAIAELEKSLGMSAEDAKAFIAKAKEAELAEMSEADRLMTQAKAATAEAEALAAEALASRVRADLSLALLTAPAEEGAARIDPDSVNAVLDMSSVMAIASDGQPDAIERAIAHAQATAPKLFTDAAGPTGPGAPTPPPPGRPVGQRKPAATPGAAETAFELWQKNNAGTRI